MRKAAGLEYEESGAGEPALLIHGALIADSFLPLAREPALAARRLIRYRRRGHGGSDPQPPGFRLEQHAQDALALLTHLGVERAHVIGHSGGGTIAVALALAAPGRVHSLALLEPAILPPSALALFSEGAAPILDAHRAGDGAKALDLWMSAVSAAGWRSAVAKVPGAAAQAERDAAVFFDVEFPAFRDFVFDAERARRISQPVLYLLGGASGPLFEAARRHFEALVPHTESVVLPGIDHLMQMGDPKRVAAPIADFLARHPL
jgi:pimeloyl-ACP methyl ester carboxylesterase